MSVIPYSFKEHNHSGSNMIGLVMLGLQVLLIVQDFPSACKTVLARIAHYTKAIVMPAASNYQFKFDSFFSRMYEQLFELIWCIFNLSQKDRYSKTVVTIVQYTKKINLFTVSCTYYLYGFRGNFENQLSVYPKFYVTVSLSLLKQWKTALI